MPAGPPAQQARRRRATLLAVVAAAVLAADQLTKDLALRHLAGGPVELVWALRLRLTFNTGAAFGIGQGLAPLLVLAGLALLVVLLAAVRRIASAPMAVALGLVLGGAVGNLTDRLVRGHGGAVVDFIDLRWWPVFNLADAAISTGAVLLVLTSRAAGRQPE
ncbi:MAG: signal peptidase II [Acidimicrobiales bacterium]